MAKKDADWEGLLGHTVGMRERERERESGLPCRSALKAGRESERGGGRPLGLDSVGTAEEEGGAAGRGPVVVTGPQCEMSIMLYRPSMPRVNCFNSRHSG